MEPYAAAHCKKVRCLLKAGGLTPRAAEGLLISGTLSAPEGLLTDGAFTPAVFAGTLTANGASIDNVTVNEGTAQSTDVTIAKVLIVNATITSGAATDELFLAGDATFNFLGAAWAGPGTFTTTGTNLTGNVALIMFTNFTVTSTSNAFGARAVEIDDFVLPADGTYYIEVFEEDDNADGDAYDLEIWRFRR